MALSNNQQAFFALLRAGLWEKAVRLLPFDKIDFAEIYNLAQEQSVVGVIAAGFDHVEDCKVVKKDVVQFIGQAFNLEQKNSAMNSFIGEIVDKMRVEGIYSLLVKGQGVAQCYERPLWRSCGDVDFFLSEDNYDKAKKYLMPLASSVNPEERVTKHLGMNIDPWVVELHGSLRFGLSARIDRGLDDIKNDVLFGGNVRSKRIGGSEVFLLGAENDSIYVFTHFLNHFYRGGIGVRQICDWCRLLWTYKNKLDLGMLESRLKKMGIVTEWKAFGAFAVDYLGMPSEALPFYSQERKWKRKAVKICRFILEVGNFGHNRDLSYYKKYPFIVRKVISFGQRMGDLIRHAFIFPWDSLRFFPSIMFNGIRSAISGDRTGL